jgi:hypothetical protein
MLRQLLEAFTKKQHSHICQNGHVVDASWDTCPYCELPQQDHVPPQSGGTIRISRVIPNKGRLAGWLVALNGLHADEDFRLHVGDNVIGGDSTCDIVLSDRAISRRHCVVRFEGDRFDIADLSSKSRTFVNGKPVQRNELIDNDLVQLGDVEFEFKARAIRTRRP